MGLLHDPDLASAVREVAGELKKIREILEPQRAASTGFRAGYEDPEGSPEAAWISQTDEVAGYLREQLTKAFGRPLTDEEEVDNGIRPTTYDGRGRPSSSIDGFSSDRTGAPQDSVLEKQA